MLLYDAPFTLYWVNSLYYELKSLYNEYKSLYNAPHLLYTATCSSYDDKVSLDDDNILLYYVCHVCFIHNTWLYIELFLHMMTRSH